MPEQPCQSDERLSKDSPVTWWRPSWRDALATVGWGWILAAIAAALLSIALAIPLLILGSSFAALLLKPSLVLAGGSVALIGYVSNRAIQARKEPFCIFCGYCLTGLPDHYRCPECGRPYTWQQIDDYCRDPQWFIERWKARHSLPLADPPVETGPSRSRKHSRDGTS